MSLAYEAAYWRALAADARASAQTAADNSTKRAALVLAGTYDKSASNAENRLLQEVNGTRPSVGTRRVPPRR